jgi:hypothetical protein
MTTPPRPSIQPILDDVRALGDQLRLQLHLAGREAARTWQDDLEPRLAELERQGKEQGQAAVDATTQLAQDVRDALLAFQQRLRG